MATKLMSLPHYVVRDLCNHLNVEGSGVRNWKDLISLVKERPYDLFAPIAFTNSGMRPYTSPANEVLMDFIARGITVDQLYSMLEEMGAVGAMETLEGYVTPSVVTRAKRQREQGRGNTDWSLHLKSHDSTATTPDSTPSPDEHPEFGVLPSHPPPITSGVHTTGSHTIGGRGHTHASPPPHYPGDRPNLPVAVPARPHRPGTTITTTTTSPSSYTSSGLSPVSLPPQWPGQEYPPQWPGQYPSGLGSTEGSGSTSDYQTSQTSQSSSSVTSDPSSSSATASNILHFSYEELSDATDGFTEGMVGIGAFGTVFKAKIRGNGPYAIKKLHTESEMGVHCGVFYEAFHRETFSQELQLLTRYFHRNILSLVAHSNDGYSPCLIYEYMENGSLAESLQGKGGVCLEWELRVAIATQIADALHFLHTVNLPTCLVHGDIKSANILLDAQFVPKLSDFGLARELTSKNSKSTVSTSRSNIVMGTMAYMAPEFLRNRKLTTRTDVYAFGVVMLELYTGEPAFTDDLSVKDRVLTDRLSDLLENSEENLDEVLMSADLKAGWPEETATVLFDIISVCLQNRHRNRPPIKQVMDQLTMIPK